jgi:hypothetical protein
MILCGNGKIAVLCEMMIFALGVVWGVDELCAINSLSQKRSRLLRSIHFPRSVGLTVAT